MTRFDPLLDRRMLMKAMAALAASGSVPAVAVRRASAAEPEWRHGLSLFNSLKYPADFKHFDYVNPNAPVGGRVRLGASGSFDSLNPYTFKGEPAGLVGLTDSELMTGSFDEASTEYGLVAEAAKHPDDFSWVTYRLRPEAKFHDGEPMKPEDVVWSMEALKGSSPQYAFYYKNVVKAEQTGEREVTFTFSAAGNRELPQIVGQLPVLPKHWWTGKDAQGRQRSIEQTTLEPPLGSGPYKVSEVKPGQSVTVKRVADYWGKDLPVNVGSNNFDEVALIYFTDETVMLEAFKGDQYDYRLENSAKNWATGYDIPAVKNGSIRLEKIVVKTPDGMQGFALNLRRPKFQDARVRNALNYVFDFEWANQNLFYGQYVRSQSYFNNSELASTGLPSPAELALLDPLKAEVPPEVFTAPYTNPVNANPQDRRKNLLQARDLFAAAGWKAGSDRVLRNDKGEAFEIEFLLVSPLFERVVLPYTEQLKLLGVKSTVRTIDSAQYERRVQNFDYDTIVASWGQSLSPGNEQRDFWGSESADRPGSRNLVGIKNPAVDKLIDAIIFSKDRQALVDACRALDRVLLWNHYVVPMWYMPYDRVALWNRFGHPDPLPPYAIGFPSIWWWDADAAAKVQKG
ncbi:MAG: extracellular solute-binding protein [Hyphomicrobiales bacterium]